MPLWTKRQTFDEMSAPLQECTMERRAAASIKVRATLYLPADLLEEARDATVFLGGYPVRLTLTRFVEDAFRAELRRLKDAYHQGRDFPRRDEDLRGGRPIAA